MFTELTRPSLVLPAAPCTSVTALLAAVYTACLSHWIRSTLVKCCLPSSVATLAARSKGSGDRLELEKFRVGAVPLEVSSGLLKFRRYSTWLLVVTLFVVHSFIQQIKFTLCAGLWEPTHRTYVRSAHVGPGAVPMGYTGHDKEIPWMAHPKFES